MLLHLGKNTELSAKLQASGSVSITVNFAGGIGNIGGSLLQLKAKDKSAIKRPTNINLLMF